MNEPLHEQVKRLEAELAELKAHLNIASEPDWPNMIGRLVEVEVKSNVGGKWYPARALEAYDSSVTQPFHDGFSAWHDARLYEGPTVPNFIPYTGQEIEGDGPWLLLTKDTARPCIDHHKPPHPNDSANWSNVSHYTELKVVV